MRRAGLSITLLAAVCLAAGCAEKRSQRCETVCQREAACAEQLDLDDDAVNKGECVRECNALEREQGGPELVARHAACVNAATTCRGVLDCP